MNRDELIAQLRDIHLPPEAGTEVGFELAVWPIAGFLGLTLCLIAIAYWRRNAWRREARARLRSIERQPDLEARWVALVDLAIRIVRLRGGAAPLPPSAYRDPALADEAAVTELAAHVRALVSRAGRTA